MEQVIEGTAERVDEQPQQQTPTPPPHVYNYRLTEVADGADDRPIGSIMWANPMSLGEHLELALVDDPDTPPVLFQIKGVVHSHFKVRQGDAVQQVNGSTLLVARVQPPPPQPQQGTDAANQFIADPSVTVQ